MTTLVPTGNTYDKYASTNPVERRLMAGLFGALDACLPVRAPATLLEVGVGEGEVTARVRERYPSVAATGVDLPDPALAAEWRERGMVVLFGDIARLPFPSRCFDLVLAVEVRAWGLYETTGLYAFIQGRYLYSALVGPMAVVALGLVALFRRRAVAVTLRGAWSGGAP